MLEISEGTTTTSVAKETSVSLSIDLINLSGQKENGDAQLEDGTKYEQNGWTHIWHLSPQPHQTTQPLFLPQPHHASMAPRAPPGERSGLDDDQLTAIAAFKDDWHQAVLKWDPTFVGKSSALTAYKQEKIKEVLALSPFKKPEHVGEKHTQLRTVSVRGGWRQKMTVFIFPASRQMVR